MIRKIFKSTIFIAIFTLLFSAIVITGVLYRYFGEAQRSQINSELLLAAEATEQLGKEYLEELPYNEYRITWIDSDGTVMYDSHVDIETMQNHSDREEISEAIADGKGSSTRYSETLTEETIYEAVRLENGSVLRISISRATVFALIAEILQPIIVILLFVIILSACLARYMAKKIVEPLNKLNLENPLENDVYAELSPLLHRIHSQQGEIRKQLSLLKNKQDEFNKITESMKEALVLLDNKHRIISLNPAAKEVFCVSEGVENENILVIDRTQEMRMAIEAMEKDGFASFVKNRDGKDYHFKLTRIDSDNGVQGVVILAFDISDKLNAERNRREFTANVSHELKTPLQYIIGSAELLEKGIVKEEDVPRFVSNIRKEASRLVDLINDIIRLSQLDEKSEMPQEELSILKIAEEVRDVLLDVANRKNVSIEIKGAMGKMKGVYSLLYEMLYNLCDNAIKYNNQGGFVKVFIYEDDRQVRVRVEDNGIGILKEHHEKIFERFYRVDKSHSKQSGGTGLGLSIVKHAALYHSGRIMIDSKINEGTAIDVVFSK